MLFLSFLNELERAIRDLNTGLNLRRVEGYPSYPNSPRVVGYLKLVLMPTYYYLIFQFKICQLFDSAYRFKADVGLTAIGFPVRFINQESAIEFPYA